MVLSAFKPAQNRLSYYVTYKHFSLKTKNKTACYYCAHEKNHTANEFLQD